MKVTTNSFKIGDLVTLKDFPQQQFLVIVNDDKEFEYQYLTAIYLNNQGQVRTTDLNIKMLDETIYGEVAYLNQETLFSPGDLVTLQHYNISMTVEKAFENTVSCIYLIGDQHYTCEIPSAFLTKQKGNVTNTGILKEGMLVSIKNFPNKRFLVEGSVSVEGGSKAMVCLDIYNGSIFTAFISPDVLIAHEDLYANSFVEGWIRAGERVYLKYFRIPLIVDYDTDTEATTIIRCRFYNHKNELHEIEIDKRFLC